MKGLITQFFHEKTYAIFELDCKQVIGDTLHGKILDQNTVL